jgi:hypothetical protein
MAAFLVPGSHRTGSVGVLRSPVLSEVDAGANVLLQHADAHHSDVGLQLNPPQHPPQAPSLHQLNSPCMYISPLSLIAYLGTARVCV